MTGTDSEEAGAKTLRRRAFVGTVAIGASVGLAGCSSLTGRFSEDDTTDDGLTADWETETTENASASVVDGSADGGELEFSVVQCNSALAEGSLGELDTELQIAFNYDVDPDEWYESRVFEVLVDGDVVYDTSDDEYVSIDAEQGTVTTGSVYTSVDVDGDTTVRLGLEPSEPCANPDHGETRFTVSALDIERA